MEDKEREGRDQKGKGRERYTRQDGSIIESREENGDLLCIK